jgi:PAS domain S-box-containing protein
MFEDVSLEPVSILVVDDRPENVLALRGVLSQQHGYRLVSAPSGHEALRCVLREDFAVVLLDVVMPEMDGFETARLIRQRDRSRALPIIFLTANGTDVAAIYKAYSVGAVDYLTKPLDPDVVCAKVAVFVELFRKTRQIERQQEALRHAERLRGEQALRASEAIFFATFEAAASGIAHLGADGRCLRVNPRFSEIAGRSERELLELRLQDLMAPEERAGAESLLSGLVAGERAAQRITARWLRRDGGCVWVKINASPLPEANGSARRLVCVIDDVTEQRRAVEQQRFLAQASELLLGSLDFTETLASVARLAAPTLADWCAVYVAEDDELKLLEVAHAEEARAAQARELLSAPPGKRGLLHEVLRTRSPRLISEVTQEMLAANARGEQLELLRKSGLRSAMVLPLVSRGAGLGVLLFGSAESNRRFDDSDLRAAADLAERAALAIDNARLYSGAQAAITLRDDFLSIASHELRTPLTALQLQLAGMLRWPREKLEAAGADKMQAHLKRVDRQVRRLSSLVESLLDVARISRGIIELHREPFDLGEMARELVGRFAEESAAAGCELILQIDGEVRGSWDRLRLEQVVTNLFSNALKYGRGHPVTLGVSQQGGRARLSVQDGGIGIPLERQGQIFDRFERAVSSREYGGLGLGLYIARQILDAHGGSVRVESEPGKGARFTVELPL